MKKTKKVSQHMKALQAKSNQNRIESVANTVTPTEPAIAQEHKPLEIPEEVVKRFCSLEQAEAFRQATKLTVNTESPYAPSENCESVLNSYGFTSVKNKYNMSFLTKEQIQALKYKLLEEYQASDPSFCSVAEERQKYPEEISALADKCGRDIQLLFTAVRSSIKIASSETASLLLSGNNEKISHCFLKVKASDETKKNLMPLAKEMGMLIKAQLTTTSITIPDFPVSVSETVTATNRIPVEEEPIIVPDTTADRVQTLRKILAFAKDPRVIEYTNWRTIIHTYTDDEIQFCFQHLEELRNLDTVMTALNLDTEWVSKNSSKLEDMLATLIA